MKLSWVFFVFCFAYLGTLSGQNTLPFSVEAGFAYYHPLMGGETKNDFNYGFSLLFSKKVNVVKISFGVETATKNYHFYTVPNAFNGNMTKQGLRMLYLDVPFLVSVQLNRGAKEGIGLLGGLVLNELVRYEQTFYYADKPLLEKNVSVSAAPGLSLRLGCVFSIQAYKHWQLNIVPFSDFKMVMNDIAESPRGDVESVPDNRMTPGFKAGMVYQF